MSESGRVTGEQWGEPEGIWVQIWLTDIDVENILWMYFYSRGTTPTALPWYLIVVSLYLLLLSKQSIFSLNYGEPVVAINFIQYNKFIQSESLYL